MFLLLLKYKRTVNEFEVADKGFTVIFIPNCKCQIKLIGVKQVLFLLKYHGKYSDFQATSCLHFCNV